MYGKIARSISFDWLINVASVIPITIAGLKMLPPGEFNGDGRVDFAAGAPVTLLGGVGAGVVATIVE